MERLAVDEWETHGVCLVKVSSLVSVRGFLWWIWCDGFLWDGTMSWRMVIERRWRWSFLYVAREQREVDW